MASAIWAWSRGLFYRAFTVLEVFFAQHIGADGLGGKLGHGIGNLGVVEGAVHDLKFKCSRFRNGAEGGGLWTKNRSPKQRFLR
jgi:hypothetical protein